MLTASSADSWIAKRSSGKSTAERRAPVRRVGSRGEVGARPARARVANTSISGGMTGWRSRRVDVLDPARGERSDLEPERTNVQATVVATSAQADRVGLAPLHTLERHRRERDQRMPATRMKMPPKCQITSAATAPATYPPAAAAYAPKTWSQRPAAGEARERDGAHARGAGQEDDLASRRPERPREAALDSDDATNSVGISATSRTRVASASGDRGGDEKLPSGVKVA